VLLILYLAILMNSPEPKINAQTPGPLKYDNISGPVNNDWAILSSYWGSQVRVDPCGGDCYQRDANANLLAAAFNAFDAAGRELGIDAAKLATKVNLTALLRAAFDVAVKSRPQSDRKVYKVNQGDIDALSAVLLPVGVALHADAEKREQVRDLP